MLRRDEDSAFEEAWQEYHREHARLRLLCQQCLLRENEARGVNSKPRGGSRGGRRRWGGWGGGLSPGRPA